MRGLCGYGVEGVAKDMLNITPIASGSTGNAYHITDGRSPVLIEAGIQFKRIQKAINFKVSELAGCLISHEHGDHSKAAQDVMKAGVDCYMTRGTAEALNVNGHRVKIITPLKQFKLKTWTVLPFPTQHDAMEPVGFLLQNQQKDKLLFLTDSFYCKYKFQGLTHIMIECNYDIDILKNNDLPPAHKKRVMQSHFSLANVKEFLRVNDLSKVVEIHLIHLSSQNSDAERFKREIEGLTGIPTIIAG